MTTPAPTTVFFDLGKTLIDSRGKPYDDALDTLQLIYERHYRIGLISNQTSTTTVNQVYSTLKTLGFSPYIEKELVTISSEIPNNVGKPSKPIFDLALQKAGHQTGSERSIFIDEDLNNVQAARSYNWRAILKRNSGACLTSEGECVTKLSALLNLLPPVGNTSGTNLNFAPHPKTVDGLWAVPIDIKRITATLTFDGATLSSTGDATMEFQTGLCAGNPIFDLRQTITNAWLNGNSFPIAKMVHHDFGGGPNAELRIIEQVLDANLQQTFQVTYTLGTPQASTVGSYQPAINWSNGPRLALNFGFTDTRSRAIPGSLDSSQFNFRQV